MGTWRSVDDAEERDGKVVVKVRGLFGGDGVTNLTLRDDDVRRSAPHAAGNARVAAMHIRRVGLAWVSSIRGRDRRAERLERREARLMGRDTLKLTLDFAEGTKVDPVMALRVLERLHAEHPGWVSDLRHAKQKQLELLINTQWFGPGTKTDPVTKEEKPVFARRRELIEAILAAFKADEVDLTLDDITFSDK